MQPLFDLLAAFPRRLLIVGGHALTAYGVFRQTIDVDCLIPMDDLSALAELLRSGGYQEVGQSESAARFTCPAGSLPDVDVLLVDAVTFEKLAVSGRPLVRGGARLVVPDLRHLIALKLHAIRSDPRREPRDFGDIAELLRANAGMLSREDLQSLARKFAPSGFETKLLALL